MNPNFPSLLKKTFFLSGALLLGWAAKAQSSTNTTSATGGTDTTGHRPGMHRQWSNRHNGSGSGRDSLAYHRPGQGHMGQGHMGQGHMGQGYMGQHHMGQHHMGQGYMAQGRMGMRGRGRGEFRGRGFGRQGFGRRGFGPHYTPEQRRQVMAINKDYRQKSQDLFKQDNITLKQYKAGLIALQKEKKDKLQGLLTQQQKDEMTARRKRMSENAQVMAVAHLERMKLNLGLNDDQVAKIKAGQENLRTQAKAIRENDNLLPQQKMEQMRTLMAKRDDTYKTVLTADQYTQFEKMHHRREGGGWQGRRPA